MGLYTHTHTHTHTDSLNKNKGAGEKTALKVMDKKRIIKWTMLVFVILAILCVSVIFINPKTRDGILGAIGGNLRNANTSNAVVSDATIISTKTGTGPFDSDDQPGNDSSENNNIVRSFDQVTWTVDLTMNSKDNKAIAGSKINVEATLPDTLANLVKWDLTSMTWMQNGQVSSDGRTVTGSYTVADTETSSSAKQTLVFVLQIYGAGNGTEIIPTFNFNIDGNTDEEKVTTTDEKVIVSAKGKYNVQLHNNTGDLSNKTTVDYGEGETSGRMYGYGFTVQLYNDNVSKGLKGLEYPKGEISFDIDLKLERSDFNNPNEFEDITNECTPILWNYALNYYWPHGLIEGRDMYGFNFYHKFDSDLPLGIRTEDDYSTYNSGNINILQENNKLKVTINNYAFNGKFPHYNSGSSTTDSGRKKVYTNNIGTFSIGYMQIFVPDNESSTMEDRNYYLTVSDGNVNVTSISEDEVISQMNTSDDNLRIQHVLYKPGSYNEQIFISDENNHYVANPYYAGNAKLNKNQKCVLQAKFLLSQTNDEDIYTADKFIKFDGEGFEPRYNSDGSKYSLRFMDGNTSFKIWYVTKKDGTNWTSQTEMNNANIEDMDIYDNIEDIPEDKICIGVYAETISGYIARSTGDNNILMIPLKVKETAIIGKTYGLTQRTRMWIDKLDRNIYTVTNKNVQWPTPTWDSGNRNYVKTEYDKDGNILSGSNNGGVDFGNTALVVGANLHGDIKAIDSSKAEKVNYDLGKNENVVTYNVEPQLDANDNLTSQITNVTLKNEVTIPKGLEYIPGSSKRGDDSYTEPEITKNSDGSTTLVWYIYGVTSGQNITPITFDANIDNETANGTQYQAKYVVSELIGSDGISKIGNSEISFRTSTVSINVINLESHRLYKEVETPIIEKNGDIKFEVTYENKTEAAVPDFQMLDILPYNGDSRGSNFNGTFTLKNINVKQTSNGTDKGIDNLKIYSTNSDEVKGMTAKDTGIGTDSIWESISTGNVNKESKGIAIKGEVAGNTKIEVTVTLATNGNNAKDTYSNNVMAQVYSNSEQMQSSAVTARVVNRYIEGKVWQDNNSNGVIDDGEKYLGNITLKLINSSNNSEVAKTTTNENGEYSFNDLAKGKYKVAIEVDGTYYYITEKEVGTNVEINSKFNEETEETDEITRLDSLQSPVLVEENVNAGLAIKKIEIPVTKQWNDNNNEAQKRPDGIIAVIKNGENEVGRQELNDGNGWRYTFSGLPKYTTDLQEINYTVEEQEKNSGDLYFYTKGQASGSITNGYTITNTFSVPDEKVQVQVTKIWDDNGNTAGKRPTSITLKLIGSDGKEYTQQLSSNNAESGNANNWVYTFNDLPKYDNYGNEITYTVDETNETDLSSHFYEKGNVDQSNKTVTNVSTYGKVTVHYYIIDENGDKTETKVPDINGEEIQDTIIEKAEGERYETTPASNVKQNYELVEEETEGETQGIVNKYDEENPQIVTYYYKLKEPTVTNTVEKTGTDRITSARQEVNYTINYTANVTDYIGNAEVTIVDTLPYAIDEDNSDLQGGIYDSDSHTITWIENVSDLDSYNGKRTVNITKNIKVVYVGLDMSQEKITNNVKGSIHLLTPDKTSEETPPESFDSTIYKSIISSEKLVDKTQAVEGENLKYTINITNSGNLAKVVTLKDKLSEGITFVAGSLVINNVADSSKTAEDLRNGIEVNIPEYSTVKVEFTGTVNELAEGVYREELKNTATVDETPTDEVTTEVTKPHFVVHKESEPASGSKVNEGDIITYRINVSNDGAKEGTVLVKDTIPKGTTFVEGSIKVGDVEDLTKTAEDLQNGISLTLGIGEEKVIEFQVRVNKLADGTKIKNTAYINTLKPDGQPDEEDEKVPEEPEHTYVEPKEEQSITKDGTGKVDSLDQEITYNIHYTASITDYEGNAKVVLVDQLPYALDTNKTNILEDLDGGTYDEASKTITWEQEVTDIQMDTTKEVTIDKTIKVVYTGISQDTVSIENVVKGHIEYETPDRTSDEVEANKTTTTGFVINIPVSKVWDDSDNKLGQRPTRVVFKLSGSDGSERTLELAKPGTEGSTTTQDSNNPNKWNDMFKDLPEYDSSNNEIVYTLTEEEKTAGDLKYYDSNVDNNNKIVTNTNKYGKVTVHHYIMNPDGSTTTTKVPDINGTEIPDEIIEGKEGDPYETKPADNVNEKYELVQEKLPEKPNGTIEKYDEEKPQEVIYYYRLKPAKVIIHYLEKDGDSDDSNNLVLANNEQIDGHVDDQYNTDTEHKKDTITKDGKTYTLVSNSGNTQGTMTVADTNVTYYYLQNTKATVRYVEGNPETGEIVKDLETPRTEEGLVGDKFVTNSKEFTGYRLIQSPNPTTIKMTKEEQTLIYYYEPVYTGLIENHIEDKTGKILYTEEHKVQVGQDYNIPPRNFDGYDRVTAKDPNNASGTMGEELVTVNYYYIKKAVLEVNYIDKNTGEPLTEQIVDDTKHEGDPYTTEKKTFEDYDLVEVPSNAEGSLTVETDENGNITNNKTVVTYYYVKKSAGVEEHHIDIITGKELEEPILHEGHVGAPYDIKSKDFLSYVVATTDKDGNNVLPTNAQGTMTEEKQVVTYYYYQPAKVIVHYVDRTTGKELEETNPETGELQSSQVIIEGQNQDDYSTTPKDFKYYELVESPEEPKGKMKVEITKDENGKDIVNNTIDVYYYYEPKPFNIGVEKDISAIIVNGNRRNATNGKLEKVDIYRKSTENTSVQVEYKIKVMNTGEVEGRAIIEDKLPEGMTLANNDGTWEESTSEENSSTTIRKVIPEMGAGETKEYTVLLNWKSSGNNMGNKVNEVTLTETDNVPGFKDSNDKDNKDNATVSISVETGEFPVGLLVALVVLVGLESVTLRYAVVLTKRQKKNNKNTPNK